MLCKEAILRRPLPEESQTPRAGPGKDDEFCYAAAWEYKVPANMSCTKSR